MPPFYPDQARPHLSETEAKTLFDQIDKIFQNTGAPILPLVLFPILFIFIPFMGMYSIIDPFYSHPMFIGIGALFPVFYVGFFAYIFIMVRKRKTQVTQLIQDWNRTEGVPQAGVNVRFDQKNNLT